MIEPASQTPQADADTENWPASHCVQAPSLTSVLKQHVIPSLTLVEPLGQLGLQEKASLDDCVIVQDEKTLFPNTAVRGRSIVVRHEKWSSTRSAWSAWKGANA